MGRSAELGHAVHAWSRGRHGAGHRVGRYEAGRAGGREGRGRRWLGRQQAERGKGRKKRPGQFQSWAEKEEGEVFSKLNPFLFLVFKSKPNSNGI